VQNVDLQENFAIYCKKWTESIAVGSKSFIEEVKKGLGFRARGRSIAGSNDHFELREDIQFWKHFFTGTRSK